MYVWDPAHAVKLKLLGLGRSTQLHLTFFSSRGLLLIITRYMLVDNRDTIH